MSNHNGNANKMVSDTLMNDNAPKREIHRLAIALDGVNKGLEAKFCSGEPILTIHPDGRVTTSDKLKPDEIAAAVLRMMKEQWLMDPQATKIRELQDRIKRLEDAGDALKASHYFGGWSDAVNKWIKAREAKP